MFSFRPTFFFSSSRGRKVKCSNTCPAGERKVKFSKISEKGLTRAVFCVMLLSDKPLKRKSTLSGSPTKESPVRVKVGRRRGKGNGPPRARANRSSPRRLSCVIGSRYVGKNLRSVSAEVVFLTMNLGGNTARPSQWGGAVRVFFYSFRSKLQYYFSKRRNRTWQKSPPRSI